MQAQFLPLAQSLLPLAQPVAAAPALPPRGARFAELLQQAGQPATTPDAAAERQRQERELRDASQGLEAMMINQLFSAMRKTVQKSGLADGGAGEEMFSGMLDHEYATQMSRSGSLGLAEMIYEQMSATLG